jgi:hypothetical protein
MGAGLTFEDGAVRGSHAIERRGLGLRPKAPA